MERVTFVANIPIIISGLVASATADIANSNQLHIGLSTQLVWPLATMYMVYSCAKCPYFHYQPWITLCNLLRLFVEINMLMCHMMHELVFGRQDMLASLIIIYTHSSRLQLLATSSRLRLDHKVSTFRHERYSHLIPIDEAVVVGFISTWNPIRFILCCLN